MRFFSAITSAVLTEFRLFQRFPRLKLATFAVSLVPAVYALIYLPGMDV